MKSNLLNTALLTVSFLSALGIASAETMHATIPFEFYANGKAMPAGAYSVKTLPGSSSVVVFVNEKTSETALAFARTALDTTGANALTLTLKAPGRNYELSMAPGSTSLKGALLTLTPSR